MHANYCIRVKYTNTAGHVQVGLQSHQNKFVYRQTAPVDDCLGNTVHVDGKTPVVCVCVCLCVAEGRMLGVCHSSAVSLVVQDVHWVLPPPLLGYTTVRTQPMLASLGRQELVLVTSSLMEQ